MKGMIMPTTMEQVSARDRAQAIIRDVEGIIAEYVDTKTIKRIQLKDADNKGAKAAVMTVLTEREMKPVCAAIEDDLGERIKSVVDAYGGELDVIHFEADKIEVTARFKSDQSIAARIGNPAILEQLAEECAELTQAALKLTRLYRGENPTRKTEAECVKALNEEAADVLMCLNALQDVICEEKIREITEWKMERWAAALDAKEAEANG